MVNLTISNSFSDEEYDFNNSKDYCENIDGIVKNFEVSNLMNVLSMLGRKKIPIVYEKDGDTYICYTKGGCNLVNECPGGYRFGNLTYCQDLEMTKKIVNDYVDLKDGKNKL